MENIIHISLFILCLLTGEFRARFLTIFIFSVIAFYIYSKFSLNKYQNVIFLSSWLLLLYLFLSSLSSWCCIQHQYQDMMCDLLIETTEHLTQNTIPYFICGGSLLGAIREKNHMIPWEHDIDLCIYKSDEERLNTLLSAKIATFQPSPLNRVIAPNRLANLFVRTYLDTYLIVPLTSDQFVGLDPYRHLHYNTTDILPLQKNIHLCGKTFFGPANPLTLLKTAYGSNFLTTRYFPPNIWQATTCRLHMDCTLVPLE
jgi:hypothetical protein